MRVVFQLPPTGMDPKPERIVSVAVPPREGETVFYLGYRYVVLQVQHHFDTVAQGSAVGDQGHSQLAGAQIVKVVLGAR